MKFLKSLHPYFYWVIAAVISGGTLLILVLIDSTSIIRAIITLVFLSICPGMAWVRMISLSSRILKVILSIAVSMLIVTITAEAMLYTRHWSELTGILLLEGITLVGIIVEGILLIVQNAVESAGGINDETELETINLNTATQAELEALPGIGLSIANRIIEHRQANGSFATIEDIQNVPGIGPATFENIKDLITVE